MEIGKLEYYYIVKLNNLWRGKWERERERERDRERERERERERVKLV